MYELVRPHCSEEDPSVQTYALYSARFECPNRYRVDSMWLTSCLAQTGLKAPGTHRECATQSFKSKLQQRDTNSVDIDMFYARTRTQAWHWQERTS